MGSSDKESSLPKIKKKVSAYLTEEEGQISKHEMVAMGAFLATLAFLDFIPEVAASHTNDIGIDWQDGDLIPSHSHHISEMI